MDCLRGCFDCTAWHVFMDTTEDLNELNDVVTDYINFCVANVIKTKCIKMYPNDKPWVNGELKAALKKKKQAFQTGDRAQVKVMKLSKLLLGVNAIISRKLRER